jgi:hypothetical protein
VNGRAFCASLGQTLPEAAFVTDIETAETLLSKQPVCASQWRAKRAFGMAGRGQRRIAPGAVTDADRSFLRASIAADAGVQIEPDVAIVRELAMHGFIEEDRAVRFGRLVAQECDEHGQWQATLLADDVDAAISSAIAAEAHHVAGALCAAGYFGPFGIDAFLYRDLDGRIRLQPRSEINARYSMGYTVGFGRR